MRALDAGTVQQLRASFFGQWTATEKPPVPKQKRKRKRTAAASTGGHASKTNSRDQGTLFVQFILDKMTHQGGGTADECLHHLNQGSGVVDVAGGSGHVSLAFGLKGILSTCVDPRNTCGMLPKRDRKQYRRVLRKTNAGSGGSGGSGRSGGSGSSGPLVLQFDSHRAWFGGRREGVDRAFSGGMDDPNSIPVCGTMHDQGISKVLMEGCSIVVALHPDEATEAALDWAIQHKRPFFIVPCCVFSRLFPERKTVAEDGSVKPVETPEEFVRYLEKKYTHARVGVLPFDGANQCVWYAGSYDEGEDGNGNENENEKKERNTESNDSNEM